jgi:hypothetical protein
VLPASPVGKTSTFRFLDEEEEISNHITDTITINSQSLRPGIFKDISYRSIEGQPIVPNMGWFTISLLILLSLFTCSVFLSHLPAAFSAFFNTTTNQIVRMRVSCCNAPAGAFHYFYLLMGLFVYQLGVIFNWDTGDGGLLRFVMFSVAIACLFHKNDLSALSECHL